MKRLILGMAFMAGATCAAVASAQDKFPSRPVKLVVPATPGGPSDLVARYMGEKLSQIWGQPVIVENKAGGKQMIAAQAVAAAPPDGYTLLQGTSNMATNPIFTPKMPYDSVKDFATVTRTHSTPMVVAVNKDLPIQSISDLITYIKKNAKDVSFGTTGEGSSQQLATLQFTQAASVPKLTEIPYQGSTAAHPDLITGRIAFMIDPAAAMTTQISSGTVRALAVTSTERLPSLPNVPTLAEAGLAGVDLNGWGGVWAPAATPPAVLKKLNADFRRVLEMPETKERFAKLGLVPMASTPEEFQRFVQAETDRWGKVVAAAK
jgi:tripartite-type tricarboxylate transporter receptor subunit TctC